MKTSDCNKQLEGECKDGKCFERGWCGDDNSKKETFVFDPK